MPWPLGTEGGGWRLAPTSQPTESDGRDGDSWADCSGWQGDRSCRSYAGQPGDKARPAGVGRGHTRPLGDAWVPLQVPQACGLTHSGLTCPARPVLGTKQGPKCPSPGPGWACGRAGLGRKLRPPQHRSRPRDECRGLPHCRLVLETTAWGQDFGGPGIRGNLFGGLGHRSLCHP